MKRKKHKAATRAGNQLSHRNHQKNKQPRENTGDEHNDCHKTKTDTHTKKTPDITSTDMRIHRHWANAEASLLKGTDWLLATVGSGAPPG